MYPFFLKGIKIGHFVFVLRSLETQGEAESEPVKVKRT